MERNLHYAPSSRSRGLYAKVEGIVRRRNYSRLGDQGPYVFHVAPKLKVYRFSKRANSHLTLGAGIGGASSEPAALPTILERLRDKYLRMMTSAASKATSTSIVHVAKPKVAPSLTSGFGAKRDVTVQDLGFSLSRHEKKYLEHLRRSVAESRGGYNLGLRF